MSDPGNAVEIVEPGRRLPARPVATDEQVDLLKATIAQGTTDAELQLFIAVCNRTGLDPFARQIHCVKRWDGRQQREVMSIQVGIDGFRLLAERTGLYRGQRSPEWCGADRVWSDVWLDDEPPAAARVQVLRAGADEPVTGVALWREYAQTKGDGSLIRMWAQMPAGMLAKCAEALALRKAFPAELSGLYAPEEIQADAPPRDTSRAQSPELPVEVVAQPPELPPDAGDGGLATDMQVRAINAMLARPHGVTGDQRHPHVSGLLGREITSIKDLSKAEASWLIDHLNEPPPADGRLV